jgi:hypothetical protein
VNHSPHRDELSHNNNQFKSESSVRSSLISEIDESSIKREPDQNENELEFDNNNVDDADKPVKKTMNDVLKLLTNKMRGSSLKDGRRGATEQDFESKM